MNEQQKVMLDQQLKLQRGAAIIEGTQDKFRQDGYSNLLNKYGTTQDSSVAYQYNQEIITSDLELIRLYESNGLFTKIIDRPSEEAVKYGFDIDFGDENIAEYVDDRMDELDFESKFATAEKWARLYGGSIIVMLVNDGRGLEEPLDKDNVQTIEELRVFERAIVQPDYTSMYNFHFLDTIDSDRPFAEPEYYQVFSIYGSFIVHQSRCLVFRNGRLPEQTTNAIYRYWGIPEYVKIKRALRECITSHENGTKLLERCVQAIYKMKNLANLLSTENGEDKVLQRLQIIDMARSILNSIAIDSDGEDYDFKTFSMAGVKEVLDSTCNMLSAVTEIPQTILFGRSPAGMNDTGEGDMENYYNMIERIQKQNMKKNSRIVIDLILRQGKNERKIPEVPKYKLKFAALWSLSDNEKANIDKTKADTELVKAQTAQVYMDSNVLDPSEVRKSLVSEGGFEIEEVLSEEKLNLPEDIFDVGEKMSVREALEILMQTVDGGENKNIEIDMPRSQLRVDERIILNEPTDVSNSDIIVIQTDGGTGSGDWGHSGRPGKIGGSGGGGGKEHRQGTKENGFTSEAKEKVKSEKASNSSKSGKTESKEHTRSGRLARGDFKGGNGDFELTGDVNDLHLTDTARARMEEATQKVKTASDLRNYLEGKGIRLETSYEPLQRNMDKEIPSIKQQTDYIIAAVEQYEDLGGLSALKAIHMYEVDLGVNAQYSYRAKGEGKVEDEGHLYLSDNVTGFQVMHEFGHAYADSSKPEGEDVVSWSGILNSQAGLSEEAAAYFGANGDVIEAERFANAVGSALAYGDKGRDRLEFLANVSNIVKSNHDSMYSAFIADDFDLKIRSKVQDKIDYPAAAVIIIKDGKILCASRRNNEGLCGPGGHVEEGEDTEDTAIREAMEEFNIVPLNLQPLGVYKGSSGSYLPSMVYWTDQISGTPEADGDEMLNEQWLSMKELQSKLLYPPFEESLHMLNEKFKAYVLST